MVHHMNATQLTIQMRKDRVHVLREMRGMESDRDLAAAMHIDRGNVSRVFRGKQQPGPRFIAGLCTALEASMNDLFVIVETTNRAAA